VTFFPNIVERVVGYARKQKQQQQQKFEQRFDRYSVSFPPTVADVGIVLLRGKLQQNTT
jgi:hypothetical protein